MNNTNKQEDTTKDSVRRNSQATIHLVEGPVGAGKSTYAAQLAVQYSAPRFNLDEWMVTLFSADRPETGFMPWYAERKDRCIEQIWNLSSDLIESEQSAVLELGLIQREDRRDLYKRVDDMEISLVVYVLDVPKEVRQQRVRQRNTQRSGTFRMHVSDKIFELANSMWQAPDEVECRERNIQYVNY